MTIERHNLNLPAEPVPLRLLFAYDSEDAMDSIRSVLEKAGYRPDVLQLSDMEQLRTALGEGEWDALLMDSSFAGLDALSLMAALQEQVRELPVIVVSGALTDAQVLALLQAGVRDQLAWSRLPLLAPIVARELKRSAVTGEMVSESSTRLTTRKVESQEVENDPQCQLRAREARYRRAFDSNVMGFFFWEKNGAITDANQAFLDMVGYTRDDVKSGRLRWDLLTPPDQRCQTEEVLREMEQTGMVSFREKQYFHRDGHRISIMLGVAFFESSRDSGVAMCRDLSEEKRANVALAASEDFHRAVLDALSEHIAILDQDGTVLAVNKAWRDFSHDGGRLARPRVGSDFFKAIILPDGFREQALDGLQSVLNHSRELFSLEYRLGTPVDAIWFRMNVTRFESANGIRLVVAHENINERKQVEESLTLLMNQNEALLNNIPDFAFIKDLQSRYIAVNEPCSALLRMRREDVLGKTDLDIWPEAQARKFQADDRFVIRTGQRIVVEEMLFQSDGYELWVETIKSPIRNNNGDIIGTAGISRDINNRKEAETIMLRSHEELEQRVTDRTAELQAANQTLQESERLRSTFVSALTHDLRTPLIAQKRLLELLQDESGGENAKMAFLTRGLLQNNENLLDMVNKLLETYQYAEGGMTVQCEPVSMYQIVEACRETLHEVAMAKHITILNRVEPDCPLIPGDPSLLNRVFMNLLGNAIENIPEQCEVQVGAYEETGFLRLEVADNGPGINPEFLPNMFDRYFPRSRGPQKIGSGLGLFICKMILELHGGRITADNQEEIGAVFTLYLPRQIAKEQNKVHKQSEMLMSTPAPEITRHEP